MQYILMQVSTTVTHFWCLNAQASSHPKQKTVHSQKSPTPTVAKVRALQIAVFTHPSADKRSAGAKQANSIKTLSVDTFEVTHPKKELRDFLLWFYFFPADKMLSSYWLYSGQSHCISSSVRMKHNRGLFPWDMVGYIGLVLFLEATLDTGI